MSDPMVERAQEFINSYNVTGIPKVEVNGKTSWTVMYALTRILQYHLGVSTLSDSFGPTTLATLERDYPNIGPGNLIGGITRVIQAGLYCKGYDGGGIDGVYGDRVSQSVAQLKADMGVAGVYPGGVTPKVFKALLTMDPYVVVGSGTEGIRSVQQWMNARYVGRRDFFIIPCDGSFSRTVQKALMFAIQYEIGMADGVANGTFGPGTKQGITDHELSAGSTGPWVQLFSAAMMFNRRPGVSFSATFDPSLSAATSSFQSFVLLPVSGRATYQTWASLLVSYGDNTRLGTGCDCVTQVTPERAAALVNGGYRTVGRYLCNVSSTSLNKMIQPGELDVIRNAGLSVFPIYQTNGSSASYFSESQGRADAHAAIVWANQHGFKNGTRIYFAVDFDALDVEVTDRVIPHFRGIRNVIREFAPGYAIGIYGPRNVCSRVAEVGFSSASFVSDMSSAFSGNMGYPMPEDWAFDQIATRTIGSGSGQIEIDNNIASGRDAGQNTFSPAPPARLDKAFDPYFRVALLQDIQQAFLGYGFPESGPEFFRTRTTTESFDLLMSVDQAVTDTARALRIRKALVQASLLWEIRMRDWNDTVAEALVIDNYTAGTPDVKDDCSTGLGQIFSRTAIRARNYCIGAGVGGGDLLDPDNRDDVWAVWQRLYHEDEYNASTVGFIHIQSAAEKLGNASIPRIGLELTEDLVRGILAAYNGSGEHADYVAEGAIRLYRVLETYNKIIREA